MRLSIVIHSNNNDELLFVLSRFLGFKGGENHDMFLLPLLLPAFFFSDDACWRFSWFKIFPHLLFPSPSTKKIILMECTTKPSWESCFIILKSFFFSKFVLMKNIYLQIDDTGFLLGLPSAWGNSWFWKMQDIFVGKKKEKKKR